MCVCGCHLLRRIRIRVLLDFTFQFTIDAPLIQMNMLVNGVGVLLILVHPFDNLVVDEIFVLWTRLHSEYQLFWSMHSCIIWIG